jgi:putative oxidoreductase
MGALRESLVDAGLLWLRVLTGAAMAYHGYGKVFGGHMDKMIEGVAGMGFPSPVFFAWAAAMSEFGGGILLVLGLFTRLAALFILITMGVAVFVVHGKDPFTVKELALAFFVNAGALFIMGGGKYKLGHSCGSCGGKH